jgi:hypothetical protein
MMGSRPALLEHAAKHGELADDLGIDEIFV